MTFINTIPAAEASGAVKEMYDENQEAAGYLPNYVRAFSHRPDVLTHWGALLNSIRRNMDARRYELVTLAAAQALRSSYCMLAHGSVLIKQFYSPAELTRIAQDYHHAELTPAEVAMMAFAEKVIRDATAITQADVEALKSHGFSDAEIFDITTAASARCFISKTADALGVEPDTAYLSLDEALRQALVVGRPIAGTGIG